MFNLKLMLNVLIGLGMGILIVFAALLLIMALYIFGIWIYDVFKDFKK